MKLFIFLILLISSALYGKDDINITPGNLCYEKLKPIGVERITRAGFYYTDHTGETNKERYENLISIEKYCPELHESIAITKISILRNSGLITPAKQQMESLIKEKPRSWDVLLSAGIFYGNIGQHDSAIKYLERTKFLENDWYVNMLLVHSYHIIGNDKKLIDSYNDGIKIDPINSDIEKENNFYIEACKKIPKYSGCRK